MRRPRHIVEEGRYHLIARANRGEFILESDDVKRLFLETLKRAKTRYSFDIEMFCIMDNHVHMVVKVARGESLSRLMQWLLSVFAIRFNRTHELKGHVWYDRFKSYVLASIRQYQAKLQYVMDNPVRAGMVKRREDYRWTGFHWWKKAGQTLMKPPDELFKSWFPELVPAQPTA